MYTCTHESCSLCEIKHQNISMLVQGCSWVLTNSSKVSVISSTWYSDHYCNFSSFCIGLWIIERGSTLFSKALLSFSLLIKSATILCIFTKLTQNPLNIFEGCKQDKRQELTEQQCWVRGRATFCNCQCLALMYSLCVVILRTIKVIFLDFLTSQDLKAG